MKKLLCVVLAVMLFVLSGCSGDNGDKQHKRIVGASFYPMYIFTLNLLSGVEDVQVECMASQVTGCLHDYTLRAKDIKLLNDAEVFVINGAGMETFLADDIDGNENLTVIDSSQGIEPMCAETHDNHSHDEEHDHAHNSHIWLSVSNAKKQLENIKDGLCSHFPEYKSIIESNYNNYVKRLNELQSVYNHTDEVKAISFHGGYDYMAKEMGFSIFMSIDSDEGVEPSAKALAHLSDAMIKDGVNAIFISPDYDGAAAEILSNETGVPIYVLDPVLSGENTLTAYEDIMRTNYSTVSKVVS